MNRRLTPRSPWVLLSSALWAAALVGACSGRPLRPSGTGPVPGATPPVNSGPPGIAPSRAASGGPGSGSPGSGSDRREPSSVTLDAGDATLADVDRLLSQWDAAQGESRIAQADALAAQITARVEAEFVLFVGAARGERGQAGSYVGTMALGFARRAEATAVLIERLREREARLVADALIALKLRADPATDLTTVVVHLASADADVRRFAPLALARVLEARRQQGQGIEPALASRAFERLVRTTQDQDPLVRLHTARALGELGAPGAPAVLLVMLDDTARRVALGAAAASARCGGREGFERVVHLLHNSVPESQPLVAAVLVIYAERLQGAPLTAAEVQRLGASAPAWARWYAEFVKRVPAPKPRPA